MIVKVSLRELILVKSGFDVNQFMFSYTHLKVIILS